MERIPRTFKRAGLMLAVACLLGAAPSASAGDDPLVIGVTTSTENSGLFAHIAPLFEAKTGIEIRAIVAGTGQVLSIARNGDVDVTLTHDPESERAFLAEGYGVDRREVMYNDFVIVGPKSDPAGIAGTSEPVEALARIAASEATFLSRGDESGTHKAEKRLWTAAGLDPGEGSGGWYLETGSGQGANLNIAAARGAYTLSDRGTWISFRNRADLEILVEPDPPLTNQYAVILVNPERHPNVRSTQGQAFIDWITSPEGQQAIADYRIDGQKLFFPNAQAPSP